MRITFIQGGETGLDQAAAVRRILAASGADLEWDEHPAGLASLRAGGAALPTAILESARATGLVLKTRLFSPPGPPAGNYNVQLRRELGLFAAVRPVRNLRGLPARHEGVDVLVIRELTEDLYSAIEHEVVPGVVQSIKVVTEAACRRFFRFALEWARAAGRKTVHCVHKANILKQADGLLLESFRAACREFPGLEAREIIVDNCCMQMVLRPQQFDVLVMGNLYGDLVSALAAGVVGGASLTGGVNVGGGVRVYEAVHGEPREVVGEDRASPLPLLLPALGLLEDTNQARTARRIRRAVEAVLEEGRALTPDLHGTATTTAMTDAILAALPQSDPADPGR